MRENNNLIHQYAQALFDALHEVRPEDQDRVLDNFVAVLKERTHLHLIEKIEVEFMKIKPESGAEHNEDIIKHFNDLVKNDPEFSKRAKSAKAVMIIDEKKS